MELEEFKASHFDNIDELIKTCKLWINNDDYEAYYRFFDMGAMEELIKEITRIKEESIPKAVVEEAIIDWDKSIAWANADDHYYAIKILQEILNKGEK